MADDVEIVSGDEEEAMEHSAEMEIVSASSATSSTDTVIDVVSTGLNTRNFPFQTFIKHKKKLFHILTIKLSLLT